MSVKVTATEAEATAEAAAIKTTTESDATATKRTANVVAIEETVEPKVVKMLQVQVSLSLAHLTMAPGPVFTTSSSSPTYTTLGTI